METPPLITSQKKAYFEIDSADDRMNISSAGGTGIPYISSNQIFTLGGANGSERFHFSKGTELSSIVTTINNKSDKIGARASLIFNSEQTVDMLPYSTVPILSAFGVQTDGDEGTIPIFESAQVVQNITDIIVNEDDILNGDPAESRFSVVVENASAMGNVHVKLIDDTTGEVLDHIESHSLKRGSDISVQFETFSLSSDNGTSVSFDYHYESDPNKSALDFVTGVMFRFDGEADLLWVNTSVTNGPYQPNVTSPSPPVDAVRLDEVSATISIFDVVNGETPFIIKAEKGGDIDEIIFTLEGNTSFETTKTVQLEPFDTASTGYQDVAMRSSNGSHIAFRYYYENDPTTGRFDTPVGDLIEVAALFVDSQRLFGGLSQEHLLMGAYIDVEFDPLSPNNLRHLEYGRNTDGQGRIYIKITDHDLDAKTISFELYEGSEMTRDQLVGRGSGSSDGSAIEIQEANESRLAGHISFNDADIVDFSKDLGKRPYLAIGGIQGENGVEYTGCFTTHGDGNSFSTIRTAISGVSLGNNTSQDGAIYIKVVKDGPNSGQVFAYKDSSMSSEHLVAASDKNISLGWSQEIILNEVKDANGSYSGLGLMLYTTSSWGGAEGDVSKGKIQFTNLGVRVSAIDYGSSNYLKISQEEGTIWKYYDDSEDTTGFVVEPGSGETLLRGSDAQVRIDGRLFQCDGITLNMATTELSTNIHFHAGRVGQTTLAQVGYHEGSIFSNAGFLGNTSDGWIDKNADGNRDTDELTTFKAGAHLTMPGHISSEKLNFFGGIQLQIGQGSENIERTVIGLPSLMTQNLGRVKDRNGLKYSLIDILGGGHASLLYNPTKALIILDRAILDVSESRARIGALQSNLLQATFNNLSLSVEKIMITESQLRDTDLPREISSLTAAQILRSSSTAMLAQANARSREILQLLE